MGLHPLNLHSLHVVVEECVYTLMVFGVHYVSALHICFLHTGLAAVFFGRLQYVTLVLIITAAGFCLPYPPLSVLESGGMRHCTAYGSDME